MLLWGPPWFLSFICGQKENRSIRIGFSSCTLGLLRKKYIEALQMQCLFSFSHTQLLVKSIFVFELNKGSEPRRLLFEYYFGPLVIVTCHSADFRAFDKKISTPSGKLDFDYDDLLIMSHTVSILVEG